MENCWRAPGRFGVILCRREKFGGDLWVYPFLQKKMEVDMNTRIVLLGILPVFSIFFSVPRLASDPEMLTMALLLPGVVVHG